MKEVREEMQAAITSTYQNNTDGVIAAYQRQAPSKGDIPTPEEFIRHASKKVKDQQKKQP